MARRGFSNVAAPLSLSGTMDGVSATSTIALTLAPTGWPASLPYFAVIDSGTVSEEVVLVTAAAGTSMTMTRGASLAAPYGAATRTHANGASIKHVSSAADFDEANSHVNASALVHGVSGSVVGTTDVQTLTGKTLTAPTVADFSNAGHTHQAVASGGVLTTGSGLLAVTVSPFNFTTTTAAGVQLVTGSPVTFTVPASGKVIYRQSGQLRHSETTVQSVFMSVGQTPTAPIVVPGGSVATNIPVGASFGVSNVLYQLGLTPGQSLTYNAYMQPFSSTALSFIGSIEVWAA